MPCKCRECYGLAEYMLQTAGYDFGLPASPGHDTAPLPLSEPCTGEMTCICPRCQQERCERIENGPRVAAQPWDVRKRAA